MKELRFVPRTKAFVFSLTLVIVTASAASAYIHFSSPEEETIHLEEEEWASWSFGSEASLLDFEGGENLWSFLTDKGITRETPTFASPSVASQNQFWENILVD